MTVETRRLERMVVEIDLGFTQNESLLKPLSAEEVALWDRIAKNVADIKAKGGEINIPREIPDIV